MTSALKAALGSLEIFGALGTSRRVDVGTPGLRDDFEDRGWALQIILHLAAV